jgi:hypothetical protein
METAGIIGELFTIVVMLFVIWLSLLDIAKALKDRNDIERKRGKK